VILQALPDIPRWYTGLAEWSAALVYISIMRPRFAGWARFLVIAAALPIMIAVQVLVGRLPLAFWTVGMAAAVFMIFGFIHLCTSGNSRDSAYLTARAFVQNSWPPSNGNCGCTGIHKIQPPRSAMHSLR
jgi:hypothetical protein